MGKIYVGFHLILFVCQVLTSPTNGIEDKTTSTVFSITTDSPTVDINTNLGLSLMSAVSNFESVSISQNIKTLGQLILNNVENTGSKLTKSMEKISQFMEQQRYQIMEYFNSSLFISVDNTERALEIVANSAQVLSMVSIECAKNQKIIYQKLQNRTITNIIGCGVTTIQDFVNIFIKTQNISDIALKTFTSVVNQLVECDNTADNALEFGICATDIIKSSYDTILNILTSGTSLVINSSRAIQTAPNKLANCVVGEMINFAGSIAKIAIEIGKCSATSISSMI